MSDLNKSEKDPLLEQINATAAALARDTASIEAQQTIESASTKKEDQEVEEGVFMSEKEARNILGLPELAKVSKKKVIKEAYGNSIKELRRQFKAGHLDQAHFEEKGAKLQKACDVLYSEIERKKVAKEPSEKVGVKESKPLEYASAGGKSDADLEKMDALVDEIEEEKKAEEKEEIDPKTSEFVDKIIDGIIDAGADQEEIEKLRAEAEQQFGGDDETQPAKPAEDEQQRQQEQRELAESFRSAIAKFINDYCLKRRDEFAENSPGWDFFADAAIAMGTALRWSDAVIAEKMKAEPGGIDGYIARKRQQFENVASAYQTNESKDDAVQDTEKRENLATEYLAVLTELSDFCATCIAKFGDDKVAVGFFHQKLQEYGQEIDKMQHEKLTVGASSLREYQKKQWDLLEEAAVQAERLKDQGKPEDEKQGTPEEEKKAGPQRNSILEIIRQGEQDKSKRKELKQELNELLQKWKGNKIYRFTKDGKRQYLVLRGTDFKLRWNAEKIADTKLTFDVYDQDGNVVGEEKTALKDIQYREFKTVADENELPKNQEEAKYRTRAAGKDVVGKFMKTGKAYDVFYKDGKAYTEHVEEDKLRKSDINGEVVYTEAVKPLVIKKKVVVPNNGPVVPPLSDPFESEEPMGDSDEFEYDLSEPSYFSLDDANNEQETEEQVGGNRFRIEEDGLHVPKKLNRDQVARIKVILEQLKANVEVGKDTEYDEDFLPVEYREEFKEFIIKQEQEFLKGKKPTRKKKVAEPVDEEELEEFGWDGPGTYEYEAMDTTGGEEKGTEEDSSYEKLIAKIRRKGLFVTRIKKIGGEKEKKGFFGKIKDWWNKNTLPKYTVVSVGDKSESEESEQNEDALTFAVFKDAKTLEDVYEILEENPGKSIEGFGFSWALGSSIGAGEFERRIKGRWSVVENRIKTDQVNSRNLERLVADVLDVETFSPDFDKLLKKLFREKAAALMADQDNPDISITPSEGAYSSGGNKSGETEEKKDEKAFEKKLKNTKTIKELYELTKSESVRNLVLNIKHYFGEVLSLNEGDVDDTDKMIDEWEKVSGLYPGEDPIVKQQVALMSPIHDKILLALKEYRKRGYKDLDSVKKLVSDSLDELPTVREGE